jgi:hypothetical protein
VEGNPVFTLPSGPAELRVTYFLKTATPLAARLRVTRGDLTIPYEVAVKPEAGRAVEVRIPLSDFKPANGNPGPALVTGDTIPIIYFYGQDLNCGLRIDALSVVELRPTVAAPAATPAAAVKPLFSDNFDAGATSFVEGEIADGGVRGKAYSIGPKGMSCWSGWNFPVKETTTIAFKFKPSDERTAIQILVWSEALRDNGRITVSQFKKDEWNEVKIKATDVRIGAAGDGRPVDLIANIKIFLLNTEAKALVDDFEIRP